MAKVNQLLLLSEGTNAGQATAAVLTPHHTTSIVYSWKEGSRDSAPALCQADHIFCSIRSFFSLLVPVKDQDKFMHNDCTCLRLTNTVSHEAREHFCATIVMKLHKKELWIVLNQLLTLSQSDEPALVKKTFCNSRLHT